jgi:hypothetical protein
MIQGTIDDLLLQLGHADVAFGVVIVRRGPEVPRKSQVVVLAVGQAGQRVVLFHQRPGAQHQGL